MSGCTPTDNRPMTMSFAVAGLVSIIARAIEIYDRKAPGSAGLIERVHLEAVEMYPVLRHAIHVIPSGAASHLKEHEVPIPTETIPSVGVPLEEKVRFLRKLLAFMSALPDTVTVIALDHGDEIEARVQMEGGEQLVETKAHYKRSDAPFYIRDAFRRRQPIVCTPGESPARCPRCCSVVVAHKGKLWGWWCPTCGVRLVLE